MMPGHLSIQVQQNILTGSSRVKNLPGVTLPTLSPLEPFLSTKSQLHFCHRMLHLIMQLPTYVFDQNIVWEH